MDLVSITILSFECRASTRNSCSPSSYFYLTKLLNWRRSNTCQYYPILLHRRSTLGGKLSSFQSRASISRSLGFLQRRGEAVDVGGQTPQPVMAMSLSSDLILEEPAQASSPRLQFNRRTRPTTADASSSHSIPMTAMAFPSVLVPHVPESPESSSSATARQARARATHPVKAARSERSPAAAPSSLSLQISAKPSKSKGSSLFSFFSVKEPSQQAFEEYERRMRAKGATNEGRTVSSGMPGVSSAKMPAMVPKVNSNWDGVPQAIKMKEREKKSGGRPTTGKYSRSISTAGSDESKRTTSSTISSDNGSIRSKPGSSRFDSSSGLGDIYGWESASLTNDSRDQLETAHVKRDHRDDLASSRLRRACFSSHPPHRPYVPDHYLDTELPPLPSALGQETHGLPVPDLETRPEFPAQSFSSTTTSAEPSPVTPHDFSPIVYGSSRQLSQFSDHHQVKTTTLLIPAGDEVIVRSAGVQILGPPVTARRKEKKPAAVVGHKPGRSDLPDITVMAGLPEKSDISDQDHPTIISAECDDSPLGPSADTEIGPELELKTKKRNKIPLLFGK